jgi:hypothetical protein
VSPRGQPPMNDPYASLIRGPSDSPAEVTQDTPVVLAGPTYWALYTWSQRTVWAWFAPLTGLVLESKVPIPGWTAGMFALALVLGLAFLYFLLAGIQVEARELGRGYTTVRGKAMRNPKLYLVHPVTKEIVSRPGEPRPTDFP